MDNTGQRFAYRCLPLLIANQAGWFVLNSHEFRATWNGAAEPSAVAIEYLNEQEPQPATTHFGHGILTWTLPYLFRTSPGYNLLARGPANLPKAGAYPLEGLVETDWSVATFTMNWKLTHPGTPVTFAVDEPICMLVPQRRGELEKFHAETRSLNSESELNQQHQQWSESRRRFLVELADTGSEAQRRAWEKDYFRGGAPGGVTAPDHQLKLQLREFCAVDDNQAECG
jgi:hypothetical protein